MTLRQLELFIAVADCGSFSRGAEAIHLTQSTVSQHISALEEEVGSRLLDRDRNGAFLTAAGKIFLLHSRRVLAERDLLTQAMASFSGLEEIELSIGASNIPANHLLPAVMPQLIRHYPGITLNVHTGDSTEILNSLLDAKIELAITGSQTHHKKIIFTPLAKDLLVLVVGPQHPWQQKQNVSLDELSTAAFVVRETGSGSDQALEKELLRLGIDREKLKVAARLGSNEAVCRTVAAGCGCAFVSERSILRELERGDLYRLPVTGMQVQRQFWIATLRGRTASPAALAVTELLLQSCAEAQP